MKVVGYNNIVPYNAGDKPNLFRENIRVSLMLIQIFVLTQRLN